METLLLDTIMPNGKKAPRYTAGSHYLSRWETIMARKVGNGSKDHGGDSAPLVPLSRRELVTLVGHAAAISAGEWITASGSWINDRTHGQQFKARFLKTSAPTSLEGIQKYLASGMIRGIGPVMPRSCCGPCPGSLPGARNGCSGGRRGRLRTGH